MIRLHDNYSLKRHNTFGVDAKALKFIEFSEPEEAEIIVQSGSIPGNLPLLVLGGGSNVLFLNDFEGVILYPNIKGIEKIKETSENVWYEAGAGETWDEFVEFCVENGAGGVENLSLIPGSVGAAPVQNIGAYGQEACRVINLINGYDLTEKKFKQIPGKNCRFSYRDSIFKNELKNRFVITSVIFKLDKDPLFNLKYGDVAKKVDEYGEVNLRNIRRAVIDIRSSKLPAVEEIGNAGSFFKNPVVDIEAADKLKNDYPGVKYYSAGNDKAKLSAGWLIEKAGWKGSREGEAGVYEKQALVLVNHGNATGKEIYDFSEKIRQDVYSKFGVLLEREVIPIGKI